MENIIQTDIPCSGEKLGISLLLASDFGKVTLAKFGKEQDLETYGEDQLMK